jgi:glycogen operon protein
LGRGDDGFSREGAFFTAIAQDPVLSRVKMIAEPWDIGPGGYQVGGFPRRWLEWNDRFRDAARQFWVHAERPGSTRGYFALRLCGSADLYQQRQRLPGESVNYVVSHDGFTLRDLLSYNHRHNLANGEDNRDGHGQNHSFNYGVEGPSDQPDIKALRGRVQRALIATMLLAQGTPMLCAGDELGHTQSGNNNPYCQDNETTWIHWAKADADLMAFTAHVLALRRELMPFANRWYNGLTEPNGRHDLAWLMPDGGSLQGLAWQDPSSHVMGCLIGAPGGSAGPILMLFNPEHADHSFVLPSGAWQAVLDSSQPRGEVTWRSQADTPYPLVAHSMVLLTQPTALA